ncbi:MAG: hypothetical protein ACI9YT_000185 [Halobacteriales archaeon]
MFEPVRTVGDWSLLYGEEFPSVSAPTASSTDPSPSGTPGDGPVGLASSFDPGRQGPIAGLRTRHATVGWRSDIGRRSIETTRAQASAGTTPSTVSRPEVTPSWSTSRNDAGGTKCVIERSWSASRRWSIMKSDGVYRVLAFGLADGSVTEVPDVDV